ncbi:MAG: CbiX/SirB N-terminal domain-containing protein [Lentisphaeria bacterium]|nr:CbiX/SirB N-terminal domain-containing protein [Lentisphaeria bacterium]NQZ70935.1 CbiX/SirB N-terminal domain-containing protein [Lentisphaeria bacterium]
MKAILLIAHGSRMDAANEQLLRIASALQEDPQYTVYPAFLELCEPSIPIAVEHMLSDGIKNALVLPYFLSKGKHWQSDIATEIDKAATTDFSYKLLDPIGEYPEIIDLLLGILKTAN